MSSCELEASASPWSSNNANITTREPTRCHRRPSKILSGASGENSYGAPRHGRRRLGQVVRVCLAHTHVQHTTRCGSRFVRPSPATPSALFSSSPCSLEYIALPPFRIQNIFNAMGPCSYEQICLTPTKLQRRFAANRSDSDHSAEELRGNQIKLIQTVDSN